MVTVIEPDADDLAGPRHGRKPVSILASHQPSSLAGGGKRILVTNKRIVRVARALEPWTIHVEPGERIRRQLGLIKQLLAIQSISCVAIANVQEKSEARHTPFCFFSCERNYVHYFDSSTIT